MLPAPPLSVRLMFTVLRITGSLDFALAACPQVFDPEEAESFARALPALLAAAAEGPVPLDDLPAVPGPPEGGRGGEWRLIDGARIDLAAVRALLDTALGAHRLSALSVREGRLVAEIVAADPGFGPADAHRAVLDALAGRDTAMAPHHYVVRHAAAAGVRTETGSGRDPDVLARLSGLT
ncbi:hypothetical protein [Kitasatospora brasiliensis]|uniref:hypothetical protein n=1 Tax=Kitasatospora brasiliensis TaxID=3058040 RepID=UPI0029313BD8|nr:hypothetical protein [Kitasatospora sp. K002]